MRHFGITILEEYIHFDYGREYTLWQGESFARSYLVRRGLVDTSLYIFYYESCYLISALHIFSIKCKIKRNMFSCYKAINIFLY